MALGQIELFDMPTNLEPHDNWALELQSPIDPVPLATLEPSMASYHPHQPFIHVLEATDERLDRLELFRKFLEEERKEQGSPTNWIMRAYHRLNRVSRVSFKGATLGSIPGVEIGVKFRYRMELSIIGLHHPFESGIEYLKKDEKIIATSIVLSGGYENGFYDNYDGLIYCGQGRKAMKGKQIQDQELKRGNLALLNSIDEKNVVRVILGSKELQECSDSTNGRGKMRTYYVYIGLYLVEKIWQERKDSKIIFKFQLGRVPGQSKHWLQELQKSICYLDSSFNGTRRLNPTKVVIRKRKGCVKQRILAKIEQSRRTRIGKGRRLNLYRHN